MYVYCMAAFIGSSIIFKYDSVTVEQYAYIGPLLLLKEYFLFNMSP